MKLFISKITGQLLTRLGIIKADSQRLSSIPVAERLKVAAAAGIALFVVTLTSQYLADLASTVVLLASMGASAVLLFGLPSSPLAKPWSFAAGHLISAGIGLLCSHLFTDMAVMAAVTIALVLFAMYLFECMHPPGGATALVPVIASSEQLLGYEFLFLPVALNVTVMLLMALMLNYLLRPRPQKRDFDPVHLHQDASPIKRTGLQPEDLLYALNHYQTVVDVSETDLEQIYQQAQLHAYQRQLGAILCRDIMSRDIICVTAETPLPQAWRLLQKHKIRTLPVITADRQLLGMVSVTDFLKDISVPHYWGLLRHMSSLSLHTSAKRQWRKHHKQQVADIMRTGITAIRQDEHVIELIPKLSELGLHQVPVLDTNHKLVGMVTQSDLIAALYANSQKGQTI
ncbi:HPP family protein [Bowmanella denitrificans]|uniref:HPP family protein n=1 Tax=Bowmanella denitrificans TaxID=366582 RepID=UPI000C9A7E56|nr:HPP family protein [Bowmanella denitrificans]